MKLSEFQLVQFIMKIIHHSQIFFWGGGHLEPYKYKKSSENFAEL